MSGLYGPTKVVPGYKALVGSAAKETDGDISFAGIDKEGCEIRDESALQSR
jgi:hypothetical protein